LEYKILSSAEVHAFVAICLKLLHELKMNILRLLATKFKFFVVC